MVSHLIMFDFVAVAGSLDERFCEYSAHLHEHFVDELKMNGQNYMPPDQPGYSTQFKQASLDEYQFPNGTYWASAQQS